jgi:hypothetical protein
MLPEPNLQSHRKGFYLTAILSQLILFHFPCDPKRGILSLPVARISNLMVPREVHRTAEGLRSAGRAVKCQRMRI